MLEDEALKPELRAPHACPADAVIAALASSREGLASEEARARRARHGPNELPRAEPPGLVRVFVRQFADPLIYVLLIAAGLAVVMRDLSDAGFILVVLLLNAVIGSIQEHRAERSAQALRALQVTRAMLIRDGQEYEVDASEVVPGDVILLEAGAKVPADARLLEGSLVADESLLTGESLAVTKTADALVDADAPLGDRRNMAWAATLVTRGRARGVVVATAGGTQVGRIARSLAREDAAQPPLVVRMQSFTRRLGVAALAAVVLLGGISLARGQAAEDVLFLAIALAVAIIPEGLPVAMTVALSIGSHRMARRGVLARRLVAVEALGSCTFIASDKTGTLTLNELTVRRMALPDGPDVEVTGSGVEPDGEIRAPSPAAGSVQRLAEAAVLCNDGFLGRRDGGWAHHGDALDVALLAMAAKAGVHRPEVEVRRPRVAEVPFEAELRYAATLHREPDGDHVAVVKGASERVLPMCSRAATPHGDAPIDLDGLAARAERLAERGYRVIAVAEGRIELAGRPASTFGPDHLHDLAFLGFLAMLDPLRPEARDAIRACRSAGIDVAMVTGDHPVTALAIARELELADRADQIVTGPLLDEVCADEQALDELVRDARVFARVEPNQKLRIVEALIRLGHFVAVTGDGANDAPALRAAHIGVAMGKRGTDVARESAELVVTDDDFASIVAGVEEGRIAYGNVRKVIFLLVSTGCAELLLFVLTTATGLPVPLTPAQLLWLNLVTNGIQDVALAFEPGEGGELRRPPRAPQEPIFDRLMIERVLVSALVIGGVCFVTYRWMLDRGWSEFEARSSLLLLLVLFENIQAGNSRSETASVFGLGPLRNPLLFGGTIAAQALHVAAMYAPGLRDVLELQPVSLEWWFVLLGLALTLLVASELHKVTLRARRPPARHGRPPDGGQPAKARSAKTGARSWLMRPRMVRSTSTKPARRRRSSRSGSSGTGPSWAIRSKR